MEEAALKTQCTGAQFEFHALGRRSVTGRFDGGRISSDAGGVLLRGVDLGLESNRRAHPKIAGERVDQA